MGKVSLNTLIDRSKKKFGSGLHPVVRESTIELIKRAYNEGVRIQISDGFRSFAEQNELYAKGRTKSGSIVTNARGGQSYHNYGLAVDFFLVSADGKKAIWNTRVDLDKDGKRDWMEVVAIAKQLGFEWGGDWSSFPDYPHLQMSGRLSISQLQAGKRPNLKSKVGGSSKPSTPTQPSGNKANLKVDGYWGRNTTSALQKALGTPVDGIISNQSRNSITTQISGVRYGNGGSAMVRSLQKLINTKVDGYLGPQTISALQNYLDTPIDRKISKPSLMVTEMQKRLNAGTFVK
ncbi:M15 family metallopeptidase [Gracilibacillus dipsosauri]|uniref:Peptidase M15 n=1 Tax=Gracilibacillus dipsosauri TaxID=178340 RepID=A0A317KXW1_9BACI|nr:M15 family metallopeptidase [Gracilibacillus dipsosauri]PWU68327.1 peptidase M15 [Gracilibacillus dipsosauri]